MMKTYEKLGIAIPEILLPSPGINLNKWAVIACDQFTSEPEYWNQVEKIVGDAPSTLNLFLPEIYLGKPDQAERIHGTQAKMREYLENDIFEPFQGLIYVERTSGHKTRKGLMLCLDLERYDYNKGSQTLIRATEGTIIERLPPRMKIREGALLELPHIMVLIDDPECTVIEPVSQARSRLTRRYDLDLMLDSGHLTGYLVDDPEVEECVIHALEVLADPDCFHQKYNVGPEHGALLFAMGDGNHSLATAKAIWEKLKPQVGMNHPARYALVEIENVHDEGLDFEPIHRVLFGLKGNFLEGMRAHFGSDFAYASLPDCIEMISYLDKATSTDQVIGVVQDHKFGVIKIEHAASNLAVGTLQAFLDQYLKDGHAESIDYVHGQCTPCKLSAQPGTIGLYLPKMDKSDLFKTVILDGALPRKTFSMGEAREKRFYMECRRIA